MTPAGDPPTFQSPIDRILERKPTEWKIETPQPIHHLAREDVVAIMATILLASWLERDPVGVANLASEIYDATHRQP